MARTDVPAGFRTYEVEDEEGNVLGLMSEINVGTQVWVSLRVVDEEQEL
jgi:hypothetical protein